MACKNSKSPALSLYLLILYIMHVRYSPLITVTIILGCLGLAGIDLYYYLKGYSVGLSYRLHPGINFCNVLDILY
jgi:hypothetical protein